MGTGQVSDGWRKNRGKDLEPQALLRRVDISDSAATASGQLAASERRGPEVQAQDLCGQRREEAALVAIWEMRSGSWRR